jgi:hypothetical protein
MINSLSNAALFSTIPVKKLVEKWAISIFKGLMELMLWDIAQFLVNFFMNFGFPQSR